MISYRFEFDFDDYGGAFPPGLYLGCGLTAFNSEHALELLKSEVLKMM